MGLAGLGVFCQLWALTLMAQASQGEPSFPRLFQRDAHRQGPQGFLRGADCVLRGAGPGRPGCFVLLDAPCTRKLQAESQITAAEGAGSEKVWRRV